MVTRNQTRLVREPGNADDRWGDLVGSRLLIVDPRCDPSLLEGGAASREVRFTYAASTLDALVDFGRLEPAAVVVAADAPGAAARDFITVLRGHSSCAIVAVLDEHPATDPGPLFVAGAGGAVRRPYTADQLWEVLSGMHAHLSSATRVRHGPLELDVASYAVRVDGRRIPDLPRKEFEVLRVLMAHAPQVVLDAELRTSIWGAADGGPRDNTIAVHMVRLRHRLEGIARIRRVRGRGYSLSLD